jgi:RND family efflux transporter MFP subunit
MYIRRVILLVFALVFVSCSQDKTSQESNKTQPLQQVNVHTLKKEKYPVWISFSGKTQAYESVDVISRVKGELLSFDFIEGHKVKKGDLLYQIDKSPYQAQYNQQLALLKKDKAALALAQATINRYKPLVDEQLAPKEKLDQLQANLKELQAVVQADEAKLNELKLNLKYCNIIASIDGYIGKSNFLVGNLINIGDKLTTITNSDKLYVYFTPTTQDVALIKKYAKEPYPKVKVTLSKDMNDSLYLDGKVDFIDNRANSSTGTVTLRAVVSNPNQLIFAGSFVHISLFLGEYEALALAINQITQDMDGEYVYVVDDNSTLHKRYIQIVFENTQMAFVKSGLKEGDRVVVGLFHSLQEDKKVIAKEIGNPVRMR